MAQNISHGCPALEYIQCGTHESDRENNSFMPSQAKPVMFTESQQILAKFDHVSISPYSLVSEDKRECILPLSPDS